MSQGVRTSAETDRRIALMEYHCTKASEVATKIFEIGLKQFADNVEYVVRYLGFLISVNDENSESTYSILCFS